MKNTVLFLTAIALSAVMMGCSAADTADSSRETQYISEEIPVSETTEESTETSSRESSSEFSETETESAETEQGGYVYSVSEAAGTWYLDGNLASDRMTVDYDGNFTNVSTDGTVTRGQVRIDTDTSDGTVSCSYAFYREDGTLWYAFAASGDIPLNYLYEVGTGPTYYRREADIAENDEYLWKYGASLEGTYYLNGDTSAERYVVDGLAGFELFSGEGELENSGYISFSSALNQDGTTALMCNMTAMNGDILLIFPVKNINDLSLGMNETEYHSAE